MNTMRTIKAILFLVFVLLVGAIVASSLHGSNDSKNYLPVILNGGVDTSISNDATSTPAPATPTATLTATVPLPPCDIRYQTENCYWPPTPTATADPYP